MSGRLTLLCLADSLAAQAAAMRGEAYESKLLGWIQASGIKPRWLYPNPCAPSCLPDATCRKGEP